MSHGYHDTGIATVWAAAGVAVLMSALLVGLHIGAAITARHRAEAAADLGALAAAGRAALGTPTACARAVDIVSRTAGTVTRCELSGWEAVVEVEVPVPGTGLGPTVATGRARAGPASDPDRTGEVTDPGPLPRGAVRRMTNARAGPVPRPGPGDERSAVVAGRMG